MENPGALQLEGEASLGLDANGTTALQVQGNPKNLNIKVYPDDEKPDDIGQLVQHCYCFRGRVEEIFHDLECLVDRQVEVSSQDGYWLTQAPRFWVDSLPGWDFWDIAGSQESIKRRLYHLSNKGHGWLDYVRSIKAVPIFGKNLGELLEARGLVDVCPGWQTVPTGKYDMECSIATHRNPEENQGRLPWPGLGPRADYPKSDGLRRGAFSRHAHASSPELPGQTRRYLTTNLFSSYYPKMENCFLRFQRHVPGHPGDDCERKRGRIRAEVVRCVADRSA